MMILSFQRGVSGLETVPELPPSRPIDVALLYDERFTDGRQKRATFTENKRLSNFGGGEGRIFFATVRANSANASAD